MLSSADDDNTARDTDGSERKDSLRQTLVAPSKKQKKKQKKIAAGKGGIIVGATDELEASTPPVDLLIAPPKDEHLLLSSSPEAAASDHDLEVEIPHPDTPPIFAQDVSGDEEAGQGLPLHPSQRTIRAHDTAEVEAESRAGASHHDEPLRTTFVNGTSKPSVRLTPPAESSKQESTYRSPQYPRQTIHPDHYGERGPVDMARAHDQRSLLGDALPPPPQLAQRHFNRVPDQAFGLDSSDTEMSPGSSRYFCGFDSLDDAVHGSPDVANNVLLVGSEGTLDAYRYTRTRCEIIGRLEGLSGSVIDAKMIPITPGLDHLASVRPLVLVTVHGPCLPEEGLTPTNAGSVNHYSTRVQVFSLRLCKQICSLFSTAPQRTNAPISHPRFSAPPAQNALVTAVNGEKIVVASGISGEVYAFKLQAAVGSTTGSFVCTGKFWTTVRSEIMSPASERETTDQKGPRHIIPPAPIFSLSSRWLAVCPPILSSSQKSIEGQVLVTAVGDAARSVTAYVSPPCPPLNCEIDTPQGPGFLNRVTKQATKEIRKHVQWVGEQGMSAIKSYWYPPAASTGDTGLAKHASPEGQRFPPTHGHQQDTSVVKIEPCLVAVVDLETTGDEEKQRKAQSLPLATFQLLDGCHYLSFAPNGLSLMATNQTGDASTLWDLTRINDIDAAANLKFCQPQIPQATGLVRKITRLSRLSPSSVLDVKWTAAGDRVGILTSKGTVHLHQIPYHDPLTVTIRSPIPPSHVTRSDLPSPSTSPHDLSKGFMQNVRSGWGNVSERITAMRSASEPGSGLVTSTRQSLSQASVAARRASGRAVRTSYNTAVDGAYTLRHSQENKIRLKLGQREACPGMFRWMSGRDEGLMSTVADGVLCTFTVKSHYHIPKDRRAIIVLDASRKSGPVQTLPPIATPRLPPAVLGIMEADSPHASCAREGIHGFWTLSDTRTKRPTQLDASLGANSVQQDKDTCPQLLPWHRLRQVSLFTYGNKNAASLQKALGFEVGNAKWCFGSSLDSVQKTMISPQSALDMHREPDQAPFGEIVGQMDGDFQLDEALTSQTTERGSGFNLRTAKHDLS